MWSLLSLLNNTLMPTSSAKIEIQAKHQTLTAFRHLLKDKTVP